MARIWWQQAHTKLLQLHPAFSFPITYLEKSGGIYSILGSLRHSHVSHCVWQEVMALGKPILRVMEGPAITYNNSGVIMVGITT